MTTENGCCVWDFTLREKACTMDELKAKLKETCKSWAFQIEKGKKTGYLHYQGRVSLKIKTRVAPIIFKTIRWSPTSNENKTNLFYVLKEETRVSGPWTDKDKEVYLPRQYRDMTLYEYQNDILKSASIFDSRTIDLIYDEKGNSGKSTIASICEILHGGIDMPPLNDFKELMSLACNICMDAENHQPKIMFFDLPRALDKDRLNGLYSAIEQIKKGKLYDCRYHYKCWWIDSPRCWVFSNHLPDEHLLSSDRWRIWTIDKDTLKLRRFPKADKSCNIGKRIL